MRAPDMDLEILIDQCVKDSDRWFPNTSRDMLHHVLGLGGETGEVLDLVKKVHRGSLTIEQAVNANYMASRGKDALPEEIVDVLIYLCNLMGLKEFKDINWRAIWDSKRRFNEERFGDANEIIVGVGTMKHCQHGLECLVDHTVKERPL